MRDSCFLLLQERNFAVKEKLFSARLVFYYEQREISQLRKNCLVRDLCFLLLTERNFAVKEKLCSARLVLFTMNREKFRS